MHEQINELFGYLHGLWRYRWSGLLIAWVTAIAGWCYVYALPNEYNARAVVNIDTSSIMKPLLKGLAVETDQAEELTIMTRVLLSRDNLLTVIRETDMDLGADTPAEKERLVMSLAKSIYLSAPGKGRFGSSASQIFEIGYESTSAQLAYKVVSTLLNQLMENTLNTDRTGTAMAQEFLGKEIKEYEQRLNLAESRLADFKTKNAGFMPDEKGGYYARIRKAEEDVERTKSSLTLAQQSYSQLRRQLSGQEPILGDARSSTATLRKYQEQLSELLTQYTEDHPDVQALRARIAEVKARAKDQDDAVVGGSDDYVYQELKFQLSQQRIEVGKQQLLLAEQQQKLKKLQESVDTIPQIEAELSRLDRDYEITKERYLSLVERKESARLAQNAEQNSNEISFQVVDAPVVPVLPSGPNRLLLLSAVLAASLGAGVAWSLVMILLFPTFVDYKQLRKLIDLPVLGSISLQMTDEQQRLRLVQLRTYVLAVFVLIVSFGSVLFYQEQGSILVRSVISDIGMVI
jgi:polysaccharide chain length determinant protein (PEP-CTERM system associated)